MYFLVESNENVSQSSQKMCINWEIFEMNGVAEALFSIPI